MSQTNPAVSIVSHRAANGNGVAQVDVDETRMLAQLDEASLMLESVNQADEAKLLYDGFSAASEYAKRRGFTRVASLATAGRIRAGRRLGEIIPRDYPHGGDRKSSSVRTNLIDIGIKPDQSSRYQRLASIPAAIFEDVIQEAAADAEGELTETGMLARADRIQRGSSVLQSESNEWYTPKQYIAAARAVLGEIDLDPASNATANQVVGAATYYTIDDDGLARNWTGRVFLNPPYGRLAGAFVERLTNQFAIGQVTAAIVLVNAHCTDTAWFQCLWDGVLCFTDHRINFYRPGSPARDQSTHGSVFAYFGADPALFAAEFDVFGAVVGRFA